MSLKWRTVNVQVNIKISAWSSFSQDYQVFSDIKLHTFSLRQTILFLLLARLMGQYCFARCRLSSVIFRRRLSSSVRLPAGGPAGRRVGGRSGDRHCTAGQYWYVPLGRHLVYSALSLCDSWRTDIAININFSILTLRSPDNVTDSEWHAIVKLHYERLHSYLSTIVHAA